MKKFFIAVCISTILAVCGCTQNNGYIGPIFGSWSLMEISVDGVPLEMQKPTVFSFQNEVVRVMQIAENPFEGETRYGNFSISDDILSIKFLTELDPDVDSYRFLMPSWLYFPSGEMPLRFDIKELKGSKMVLVLYDGSRDLTYSFEKTW